jgi:hypothetical protein
MARMIGRSGIFACGCCHSDTAKRERRQTKRRERQAWKKEIRRG